MWIIFKVFIELVTTLFLFFMFWYFGRKAHGILAFWPGADHIPPVLEGAGLTSGPPGESQAF